MGDLNLVNISALKGNYTHIIDTTQQKISAGILYAALKSITHYRREHWHLCPEERQSLPDACNVSWNVKYSRSPSDSRTNAETTF